MKKYLRILFLFLPLILLMGCISAPTALDGFKNYYESWSENVNFPESGFLQENEKPQIIVTSDVTSKIREISSQWYWCIGYSGFNGIKYDDLKIHEALENLCFEKKAKIAIYSRQYTDTRSGITSYPYTNYHHDIYGSTYTTTSYLTDTYSIDRYDYSAYFFIEIPDECKMLYAPGFAAGTLTQQERDLYKHNTGVIILTVYENSSAYMANLLHGDIITKINETPVYTYNDFVNITNNSHYGDIWNITIIRDGQEKQISLIYK